MVHAGHFARTDDVFKNAVGFEENMLAVRDLDLAAHDRIDERQFGQPAVVQLGQGFEDLTESRFADEHRVENAVCRVSVRILTDTASGERSVTDVHGEEPVVHRLFAVHRQHHVLCFVLDDRPDETEEIVHVVRTDVVFECLGFFAAEGIDTETDGVDEIAVVLDVIAPIGDASYVNGMSFSLEEAAKRFFVVLGQPPVSAPVVPRAPRHQSHLDLRFLRGTKRGTHDTVDRFGESAVTAENKYLVIPFFYQLTRQFDGVSGVLGDAVRKGLMTLAQQFP